MDKAGEQGSFDLKKAMLENADAVFDGLLAAEIVSGKTPNDAKKSVLLKSVEARYGANGRAMRHIRHFLSGSGTGLEISLIDLLNEDWGIRKWIEGETIRRANGIETLRETYEKQRMSLKHGVIDSTITLFQKNYAVEDWCGALGTLPPPIGRLLQLQREIVLL
jgi:hypothetical protein